MNDKVLIIGVGDSAIVTRAILQARQPDVQVVVIDNKKDPFKPESIPIIAIELHDGIFINSNSRKSRRAKLKRKKVKNNKR